MKFILISIIILMSGVPASAQGCKISVELPGAAGNNVLLAHYYAKQLLINDTIRLDNNGRGIFEADTLLPEGLYMIYFNNDNHFDFLLSSDQDFTIANKNFSKTGLQITGSTEGEEFVKYTKFLDGLQQEKNEIIQKSRNATAAEKVVYQNKLDTLTNKLHDYWIKKAGEYPGTWLAAFLMADYVPSADLNKLPEEVRKNDTLRLRYKFDYQEKHYFDYFDVTDKRFLYTPLITPKLETYFTKILYQQYDTVRAGIMNLIEKSRPCKPMFRYIVSYFLNESYNSKLMGLDALFDDIARKYYLSGMAYWADSATIATIRENVIFSEHNLLGMTAPELKLEGLDSTHYYSLHEINAKVTVVLIYEPNCSHCQTYVPALYKEVFLPYKNYGLEVYAIYSMDNREEWVDFIQKENLYDWINVWDENNFSGFKVLYDARKTPAVYVLDQNKKIIAKNLSVDQVKKVVESELGITNPG